MTYRNVAVVVDAERSGSLLSPAFRRAGVSTVHVHSPRITSSRPDDHLFELSSELGVKEICEHLDRAKWQIVAVVPGLESGVALAEEIARALGLPNSNDPATSHLRLNKGSMFQAARRAGINSIPTRVVDDESQVGTAITEEQWGAPYVVKPAMSAGTDGVSLCTTVPSATDAAKSLLNRINRLGQLNKQVTVQPYLHNQEYVVDTVSFDGEHLVSDVWLTVKGEHNDHSFVPEYTESVLPGSPWYSSLTSLARRNLDAIGIRYGAGHTELFVLESGQVCIVEAAARVHGAGFPRFADLVWGRSQVSDLVDTYAEGRVSKISWAGPPSVLRIVELIATRKGLVRSVQNAKIIRALRSYQADVLPSVGELISPTIDAYSSPGVIVLASASGVDIDHDYRLIRNLESRNLLYELES